MISNRDIHNRSKTALLNCEACQPNFAVRVLGSPAHGSEMNARFWTRNLLKGKLYITSSKHKKSSIND